MKSFPQPRRFSATPNQATLKRRRQLGGFRRRAVPIASHAGVCRSHAGDGLGGDPLDALAWAQVPALRSGEREGGGGLTARRARIGSRGEALSARKGKGGVGEEEGACHGSAGDGSLGAGRACGQAAKQESWGSVRAATAPGMAEAKAQPNTESGDTTVATYKESYRLNSEPVSCPGKKRRPRLRTSNASPRFLEQPWHF